MLDVLGLSDELVGVDCAGVLNELCAGFDDDAGLLEELLDGVDCDEGVDED